MCCKEIRSFVLALALVASATFSFPSLVGQERSKDPFRAENALVSDAAARNYQERVLEPLLDVSKIEEISVEFYRPATRRAPIRTAELPRDSFAEVLEAFRKPVIDQFPNFSVQEVGSLRIKTIDGDFSTIVLYGGLKSELRFSVSGVRCTATKRSNDTFRDESAVLESIVRKALEKK